MNRMWVFLFNILISKYLNCVGGGVSSFDIISAASKSSMCPIALMIDLCYFCLIKAGYEIGSWIGVLRDQNTHADNR